MSERCRLSSLDDAVLPRLTKALVLDEGLDTAEAARHIAEEADRLRDLCFEIMMESGAARADAFGELGFPVNE